MKQRRNALKAISPKLKEVKKSNVLSKNELTAIKGGEESCFAGYTSFLAD